MYEAGQHLKPLEKILFWSDDTGTKDLLDINIVHCGAIWFPYVVLFVGFVLFADAYEFTVSIHSWLLSLYVLKWNARNDNAWKVFNVASMWWLLICVQIRTMKKQAKHDRQQSSLLCTRGVVCGSKLSFATWKVTCHAELILHKSTVIIALKMAKLFKFLQVPSHLKRTCAIVLKTWIWVHVAGVWIREMSSS